MAQPKAERDKTAYFKTLIWTLRYDFGVFCVLFALEVFVEIFLMSLAKQFYVYLSEDPKEVEGMGFVPVFSEGPLSILNFMWLRHKGFCIIFLMTTIKVPFKFFEEKLQ
jgi:hypothetical protein